MEKQHTYYRKTTYQQRVLLFKTWEETGSVTVAAKRARVCRGVFYMWKARYDEAGYEGLKEEKSHAPHTPRRVDDAISARVIELRKAHPDWGKLRIAQELAKEHSYVSVVSPNTVKRILVDANLWPGSGGGEKGVA